MKRISTENPFQSFWMGGFECTDQLNVHGDRVDLLQTTSHLELLEDDYALLSRFGIRTVREGVRWSRVETVPYRYDFQTLEKMLLSGREMGIQQLWDLCHFGYPDDLTPLHPKFADRFAAYCKAFALFYKSLGFSDPLIVTPVNEVSFISWLGGQIAATSPFCHHNGWEVKYALMRAYIKGEVLKLLLDNYPVWGVCVYPVLDRPDWDNPDDWHHSGLWDRQPGVHGSRILHLPTARAVAAGQNIMAEALKKNLNAQLYPGPAIG